MLITDHLCKLTVFVVEVWHVVIPVCGTAVAIATIAAGVYIYKKPVRRVEDNEQLSTIPENRVTQYGKYFEIN